MTNEKKSKYEFKAEDLNYVTDYLLYVLENYIYNQKLKSAIYFNQYINIVFNNKELTTDYIDKMLSNSEYFKDIEDWHQYMTIKKLQLKYAIIDNFEKDEMTSIINIDPRSIYSRVSYALEEDITKEEMSNILLQREKDSKKNKEEKNE